MKSIQHNLTRRNALAGFLILSLAGISSLNGARVTLVQESFETADNQFIATPENNPGPGEVAEGTYVVIGHGDDNETAYIARRKVGSAGSRGVFGGTLDGEWFFGFADNADVPGPRGSEFVSEEVNDRAGRVKFSNINVEGIGNIELRLAAAIGDIGPEPDNDFWIRVRFDQGDWLDVGGFKASTSNGRAIYYAGPRDTLTVFADPNKLHREFTDWSWDIVGSGAVMDLEITVDSNYHLDNYYIDNVKITGEADVLFVDASFELEEVTEPDSGEIANPLTVTLNQAAASGGITLNISGQDRVLDSLADLGTTVTVAEGETTAVIPTAIIQDGKFTGTKLVDIYLSGPGVNTSVARTRVVNTSPVPMVTITEAMNVVPGLPSDDPATIWPIADANGDGDRSSSSDDCFVEIVNFGTEPVNLNGWRIGDDLADRHTIGWSKDVILYPNTAYVLFSGSKGNPRGKFGGAIVEVASAGGNGLGFNITSRAETPNLSAPFGALVDLVNLSLVRADITAVTDALPEGDPAKGLSASAHALVKEVGEVGRTFGVDNIHSLIEGVSPDHLFFSPGLWYDGTPYFEVENEINIALDTEVITEDDGENAATGTINLSNPAPAGGLDVELTTDGVLTSEDGSIIPGQIDLDSLVVTLPEGSTSTTFRIGAVQDNVLDGDKVVSFEARAGPYVLPGFVELLVQETQESDLSVIINEVFNDAEGAGEDYNLDGEAGTLADQFVEVVNVTGRPVNLSNWLLEWNLTGPFSQPRKMHWFPKGTWLPDGGSIVVFSAISRDVLDDPSFGGAVVQEATSEDGTFKPDRLDLIINEDIDASSWNIRLYNDQGFVVNEHSELEIILATQDQSLTLSPDVEGEFMLHLDAHLAGGGLDFLRASPGLKLDGTPFEGNGNVLLPTVFVNTEIGGSDGWFFDPKFGWMASGGDLPYDMPWVFTLNHETFWYVHEASRGGNAMYIYDLELGTWVFTNYIFYPWMYDYNTGNWFLRD